MLHVIHFSLEHYQVENVFVKMGIMMMVLKCVKNVIIHVKHAQLQECVLHVRIHCLEQMLLTVVHVYQTIIKI